jgi:hypothetical protein
MEERPQAVPEFIASPSSWRLLLSLHLHLAWQTVHITKNGRVKGGHIYSSVIYFIPGNVAYFYKQYFKTSLTATREIKIKHLISRVRTPEETYT